jgi:hypothetical protein
MHGRTLSGHVRDVRHHFKTESPVCGDGAPAAA